MTPTRSDLAATLLRLVLGTVLLAHGLMKVFVFTLPGTAGFFASVGFPGWTAYPVTAFEVFGGLALIAGLRSSAVAIAAVPVLLGAMSVHLGNGWVFSAQGGGWEYPLVLVLLSVAVALLGDGACALGGSRRPAAVRRASVPA